MWSSFAFENNTQRKRNNILKKWTTDQELAYTPAQVPGQSFLTM